MRMHTAGMGIDKNHGKMSLKGVGGVNSLYVYSRHGQRIISCLVLPSIVNKLTLQPVLCGQGAGNSSRSSAASLSNHHNYNSHSLYNHHDHHSSFAGGMGLHASTHSHTHAQTPLTYMMVLTCDGAINVWSLTQMQHTVACSVSSLIEKFPSLQKPSLTPLAAKITKVSVSDKGTVSACVFMRGWMEGWKGGGKEKRMKGRVCG